MIEDFKKSISTKLEHLKNKLDHKKIKYSTLENFCSIKIQHFYLSIVLRGSFILGGINLDLEEISEIVVDIFIEQTDGISFIVGANLSYGNGVIISEVIINNVDIQQNSLEVFEKLNRDFLSSVELKIYDSVDLLKPILN